MIKKRIKYEDFDGNQREEDFYFNLSKSELSKMQLSVSGGFDKLLEKVVNEKNVPEIMKTFEEIILTSYGEKSNDGKYFNKSPEMAEAFKHTAAYDELFMSILSSPDAATEFIRGILPASVSAQIPQDNA